jgi:hypothetical protein
MSKFIKKIFDKLFPKSEIDEIHNEILQLLDSPSNYGKIAFLYLKLHNRYGVLIGKGENDSLSYFYASVYYKQYQLYRELYFEQPN